MGDRPKVKNWNYINSWKWTGIYIVPIHFGSPKTIYSIAHELALNRSTSKSVATLLWEFSPSYRQTRLAPWKTYSSEYIVSNYTALCNTTTAAKTLTTRIFFWYFYFRNVYNMYLHQWVPSWWRSMYINAEFTIAWVINCTTMG